MSRNEEGAADVQQKVSELKDAAGQVGQNLRDLGGQAKEAATQRYSELRDQANQYYSEGRQRATEWEQGVEKYIQDQPLKAVLIAAGAGLLLGMIWKR